MKEVDILRATWTNAEKLQLIGCKVYPDRILTEMITAKGSFEDSINVRTEDKSLSFKVKLPKLLANKKSQQLVHFNVHFDIDIV